MARDRIATELGLWLFGHIGDAKIPGHSRIELHIGEAAMALEADEIALAFRTLLKLGANA